MTRDIDDLLRRLAAQEQPTPADAERVRARVQELSAAPLRPRRVLSRPVFWAVAASVCLLLLAGGMWRDVGTDSFTLADAAFEPDGNRTFEGRLKGLNSYSPAMNKAAAEEEIAKISAHEYRLTGITGTTINGRTRVVALAIVDLSIGPQECGINVDSDLNDPSEALDRDMQRFYNYLRTHEAKELLAGRTRMADTTVVADGLRFRCTRERLVVPTIGPVIFWRGKPGTESR